MTGRSQETGLRRGRGILSIAQSVNGRPRVMRVHYYRPETFTPDSPIVFVLHGMQRNAEQYRDNWRMLGRQYNALVLAPEFSQALFPGARSYNRGNLVDREGTRVPSERWSFRAIESLFDTVRALSGSKRERYRLVGHSAGAQFVHRYMLFMHRARVEHAIAANAGWYSFPDLEVPFPHGLGEIGYAERELRIALGRPLTVMAGELDTSADENLERAPLSMAQGEHRLARAGHFFEAGRAVARRLGVPFGWRFASVPGVGHDDAGMAPACAQSFEHWHPA